jgi:hypothetical protein
LNSYNGFEPGQRYRALRWLKGEVAAGHRRPPEVCEACGQTEGIVEAHSEDYSAPFGDHIGAYGFCYVCHMMLHCRHHDRARWDRYRQIIREGYRAPAPQGRAWGAVKAILSGQEPLWTAWAPARERTVLDDIDEGILRRANDQEDRGQVG